MDLVLQGLKVDAADVAAIASLAGAQGHPRSCRRFPGFSSDASGTQEGVADRCVAAGIDHAFVPSDLARDRVRVVAMDMDSTLITIECIDEIAARARDQAEGRRDHRRRDARRDRLRREPHPARRAARGAAGGRARARLRRAARALAWRRAHARRIPAAGAKTLLVSGGFTFFTDRLADAARLRRNRREHARDRRRPADRSRRAADRRR